MKKKNGFTLIEIMVIIMILALVSAIVIPVFRGVVEPTPPANLNVNTDKKWELWAEGKVINRGIDRPDWCDTSPPCKSPCLRHGNYYIEFENLGKVKFKKIVSGFNLIKIGEIGKFYRYKSGATSLDSWYQWIKEKDTVEENIAERTISFGPIGIESTPTITPKIEDNKWKRADLYQPKTSKVVLVKLDNDVVVIAYFTIKEEWKLNFYKKKINGGISLRNVVDWKEINID